MGFAEDNNLSVTIHVERFNPAMELYKKLGFVLVSQTNEVYHLLEWKTENSTFQENIFYKQSVANSRKTTTFNNL